MIKVIGITGQVGSGKSEILNKLSQKYKCKIIMADNVAHEVREKGGSCYDQIINILGQDILLEDGSINRKLMASRIFDDKKLLKKINDIIHPAVWKKINDLIASEKSKDQIDYIFLEAALLLEAGYDKICDEIWFIYVRDEVRRKRLKTSRHYSDEKINSILKSQKNEDYFKEHCKWTIDNSDELSLTMEQIDYLLRK